jgi:SpoVK/Ycf46/Vps4 family AAA+-type ATPase
MRSLDDLSSALKKLIIPSEVSDKNVFLNESTRYFIETLVLELQHIQAFEFHNIPVRNKILLHGVTGNGKTTIARYIAKRVKLPFIEIKSDEVIDSHLGSTSSNINMIFNQIKEPCILFWDEVDSIGCKRGGDVKNSAGHENDRITNSILINIEKLDRKVIFIGATNRIEILDSAFLRRFDVQFEILAPTADEKQRFVRQLLDYHKLPIEINSVEKLQSYSDIENYVINAARDYILSRINADKPGPDSKV